MTMTGRDAAKYDRLPKWARDEIGQLRGWLATAHAQLAAGPGDSDTFANPHAELHGSTPQPLGKGTTIYFGDIVEQVDGFRVKRLPYGGLQVQGDDWIVVVPQSGNTVVIRSRK